MNIAWIDLETSGLDSKKDKILEIGLIITDDKFNELARYSTAIKHSEALLEEMDAWCVDTHTRSGLVYECFSADAVTLDEALNEITVRLNAFCDKRPMLGGYSPHFDRDFLQEARPLWVHSSLHYRNFDASTLRAALKAFNIDKYNASKTLGVVEHRALADIEHAIETAKVVCSLLISPQV